jgi:signal transduction histidine kinase
MVIEQTGSVLDEGRLARLIAAGRALVSQFDDESILERLLECAKEITDARYAALAVLNESGRELERFIFLGVDPKTRERIGDLPCGKGVLGLLIEKPEPLRLDDVTAHPSAHGYPRHHPQMRSFLGVPVMVKDRTYGILYLTEKAEGTSFDEADEQAAVILAEWAAIAIENARATADDRLRESIETSERERARWSRELHDQTLQGLGALRVLLASALRGSSGPGLERAISEAVAQLGDEIDNLRGLITELRPAALDELGLQAALEGLVQRSGTRQGLNVQTVIALAHELGTQERRLEPELESTIYRVVQEALTNIARHAHAEAVMIELIERESRVESRVESRIELTIEDDGVGFDPTAPSSAFGLQGMRERVELAGGTLEIDAAPGAGTRLQMSLPVVRVTEVAEVRGAAENRARLSAG